jgi:hypothetical protein
MKIRKREKRKKRKSHSWLSGSGGGGGFGLAKRAGARASRPRRPTIEGTTRADAATTPWARAHLPARGSETTSRKGENSDSPAGRNKPPVISVAVHR